MTDREQITAFAGDLDNLVEHYTHEFNLSLAACVGVLHIKAHALTQNQLEKDVDNEDDIIE